MSRIKINNQQTVDGKFSFSTELDESSKPARCIIQGVFQTAEYIEEITKLESERYMINNIKVTKENFGSEERDIVYVFTAGSFCVKPPKRR